MNYNHYESCGICHTAGCAHTTARILELLNATPSKWSFERLLEEWSALVKSSPNLDVFRPKRDALIQESGWTKKEFYTATDRYMYDSVMGKSPENTDQKTSL